MKQKQIELRTGKFDFIEEEGVLKVEGYANKTNEWSQVLFDKKTSRYFREKITPGTFALALKKAISAIYLLDRHDDDKILSSTRNGLNLIEDENGLKIEARISPTSYGKDAYQLIKDGHMPYMSFGMNVEKDEWRQSSEKGIWERVISAISLYEVSVVPDPAYLGTSIEARGYTVLHQEVRENGMEEALMNEQMKEMLLEMLKSDDFKDVVKSALSEALEEAKPAELEVKEDDKEEDVEEDEIDPLILEDEKFLEEDDDNE